MDRTAALAIALILAAALYAYSREADASVWQGDGMSPPDDAGGTQDEGPGNAAPQVPPVGGDPVAAILATIKEYEADGNYDIIVGGQRFDSYADHPRVKVWFYDPRRAGAKGTPNNWSDAAGGYQFISRTWDVWKRRLALPDFSPASQDRAAIAQLEELGVIRMLRAGDVQGALTRASAVWASLPGSASGQHQRTMTSAVAMFNSFMVA